MVAGIEGEINLQRRLCEADRMESGNSIDGPLSGSIVV